jgi:hypothetical protein
MHPMRMVAGGIGAARWSNLEITLALTLMDSRGV